MQLPWRERAIVKPEKVRDYLLSRSHPSGGNKAAFFESLGFRREKWQQLESALRWHSSSDVEAVEASSFGHKYKIRASLTGPSGRTAIVVSVWIVPPTEDAPRFVTAFPGYLR